MSVITGKSHILDVVYFQGFSTVTTLCPTCTESKAILVPTGDFARYVAGGFVQDCFPYLTPDERELLVSGMCGTCWDLIFGDDD